jgi:hypothetical protein
MNNFEYPAQYIIVEEGDHFWFNNSSKILTSSISNWITNILTNSSLVQNENIKI